MRACIYLSIKPYNVLSELVGARQIDFEQTSKTQKYTYLGHKELSLLTRARESDFEQTSKTQKYPYSPEFRGIRSSLC